MVDYFKTGSDETWQYLVQRILRTQEHKTRYQMTVKNERIGNVEMLFRNVRRHIQELKLRSTYKPRFYK